MRIGKGIEMKIQTSTVILRHFVREIIVFSINYIRTIVIPLAK